MNLAFTAVKRGRRDLRTQNLEYLVDHVRTVGVNGFATNLFCFSATDGCCGLNLDPSIGREVYDGFQIRTSPHCKTTENKPAALGGELKRLLEGVFDKD